MNHIEIIGYFAGTCTTVCYLPQVWSALRTRSLEGVSLWMCVLLFLGVLGWATYGFLLHEIPMILFNSISLVLVGTMIWLKLQTQTKS